jgi:hypothetical protein
LAVWNHCLGVFEICVDECLLHVGKKKAFDWKDGGRNDLEGLLNILYLTEHNSYPCDRCSSSIAFANFLLAPREGDR